MLEYWMIAQSNVLQNFTPNQKKNHIFLLSFWHFTSTKLFGSRFFVVFDVTKNDDFLRFLVHKIPKTHQKQLILFLILDEILRYVRWFSSFFSTPCKNRSKTRKSPYFRSVLGDLYSVLKTLILFPPVNRIFQHPTQFLTWFLKSSDSDGFKNVVRNFVGCWKIRFTDGNKINVLSTL